MTVSYFIFTIKLKISVLNISFNTLCQVCGTYQPFLSPIAQPRCYQKSLNKDVVRLYVLTVKRTVRKVKHQ